MNSLNFVVLMLMIQLPFTDEHNAGGVKNKVKSGSVSICEWKIDETNTDIKFCKWTVQDNKLMPGIYVRSTKPVNNLKSRFENSFVVSNCSGNVIIDFLVDRDGYVVVDFKKKKKDGC